MALGVVLGVENRRIAAPNPYAFAFGRRLAFAEDCPSQRIL